MPNTKQSAIWRCTSNELRDYGLIPESTLDALIAWVIEARQPGHFVTACLNNNLMKAMMHADQENMRALWAIASFIYNRMPSNSHGSVEQCQQWQPLGADDEKAISRQMKLDWMKQALMGTVLDGEVSE